MFYLAGKFVVKTVKMLWPLITIFPWGKYITFTLNRTDCIILLKKKFVLFQGSKLLFDSFLLSKLCCNLHPLIYDKSLYLPFQTVIISVLIFWQSLFSVSFIVVCMLFKAVTVGLPRPRVAYKKSINQVSTHPYLSLRLWIRSLPIFSFFHTLIL